MKHKYLGNKLFPFKSKMYLFTFRFRHFTQAFIAFGFRDANSVLSPEFRLAVAPVHAPRIGGFPQNELVAASSLVEGVDAGVRLVCTLTRVGTLIGIVAVLLHHAAVALRRIEKALLADALVPVPLRLLEFRRAAAAPSDLQHAVLLVSHAPLVRLRAGLVGLDGAIVIAMPPFDALPATVTPVVLVTVAHQRPALLVRQRG